MEYIVHNLFSTEAGVVWLVLKWALVVLAAGFVGQFGKTFASYLLRRAAEGKQKETAPAARQESSPPAAREETALPVETRAVPVAAAGDGDAGEQERKKALKAQQKAGKKAAKAIKKLFK
jgi:hypothetical protein